MSLAITIFIASFLVLLWSSKLLPQSISTIARGLRLSEFITAFFLVSFVTSVPEFFIGISSALQGIPSVSLGDVMGANLINLTLVIGVCVVIAGAIKGDGQISSENFWLIFLISLLPVLLAADGVISRGDGAILLIAFGLYIIKIFKDQQYFHKELIPENSQNTNKRKMLFPGFLHAFTRFFTGVSLLLGSSFALIWSSKIIIEGFFGHSLILFGALFIALGTTIPELAFGIRSSLRKQPQLMLGNSVGTIAFNAAGVVGLVSIIEPIALDFTSDLLLIASFLFLAFTLFHLFVYTKKEINRFEGFILVLVYMVFLAAALHDCVLCVFI